MPAVIIDCETNSIIAPEPIEVAVLPVDFIDGKLQAIGPRLVERFKPEGAPDPIAVLVHGILPCELAGKAPSSQAKSFVERSMIDHSAEAIIGHNVDFDAKALDMQSRRRICTISLARKIWPSGSHKLGAMMYRLKGFTPKTREQLQSAHGAAADVDMTFELLVFAAAAKEITDIDSLWFASENARVPTRIEFGKHKGELIKDLPYGYRKWLLEQSDIDPYLRKVVERVHRQPPIKG